MRGFFIHLKPIEAAESEISRRLSTDISAWKKSIPIGKTQEIDSGRFSCVLYSFLDVPPEYNQVWKSHANSQGGCLYLGPRVFLSEDKLPPFPPDGRPSIWATHRRLFSKGMETCVLVNFNRNLNTLAVKTDLLNSTYVYHIEIGGHLLLSGSSLVLSRILGKGLDSQSCLEFLATGSIYGNRALYQGIRSLEPSRFFQWDSQGRKQSAEYWQLNSLAYGSLGLKQSVPGIIDSLDADFHTLETSKHGLVFDLTGGYDSRCNFGFALRNKLEFRTIVSGDEEDDDAVISERLSAHYGVPHTRVPSWSGSSSEEDELLSQSEGFTDLEYDICEYANILQLHRGFYGHDEISVHGSTADVMRNYFLLKGFYFPNPDGKVAVDQLVRKKFTPCVDVTSFFEAGIIPDWIGHMEAEISRHDHPELPAYARLDNIYLRIRMQFWQGRLASSTNRLHASFTPWTNLEVLEFILTTRWQEKNDCMLSRSILNTIHPHLDRFPLTGGSNPGLGPFSALRTFPSKADYYRARIRDKLFSKPIVRNHPGGGKKAAAFVSERIGVLEGVLSQDTLKKFSEGFPPLIEGNPTLVQRLLTAIRAVEATSAP